MKKKKQIAVSVSKEKAIDMLIRYKPKMVHRSKKAYNRQKFKKEV
jgi:hypothetical protein